MTVAGNGLAEYLDRPPAEFSPDRQKFTVVTRKGNIRDNTNEYSLWLFRSRDVLRSLRPKLLLTRASSSSRPAIDDVRWLRDNETIAFIGEQPGKLPQIYSLNTRTLALAKLSSHRTSIVAFDTTADLNTVAFLARPAAAKYLTREALQRGILVSTQQLTELMMDRGSDPSGILHPFELFVRRKGGPARPIDLHGDKPEPQGGLFLSQSGRYLVLKARAGSFPDFWKDYKDPWNNAIHDIVTLRRGGFVPRYLLIDTRSGSVRPLVNAPVAMNAIGPHLWWCADGKSVVAAATYLPLDLADEAERSERESNLFAVEVEVETGRVTKIATGNSDLLQASSRSNSVLLQPTSATGRKAGAPVAFRKTTQTWEQIDPLQYSAKAGGDLEVLEEQDMNTAPRLVAVNRKTHEKSVLMDLNPQFRNLRLGKVEEIAWQASDSHEAKGGLYLPPDYVQGQRYPLVIQTHGWQATKFWIDGVSTAGYAAQALAAKGFVVAQVGDEVQEGTTEEGPRAMATFEGLIDCLDKRGLIDRERVGLMGWSRTGFHIRYALTFSKYHFAAAAIADGMDSSYVQYMSFLNLGRNAVSEYERINGAAPFGEGLKSWVSRATGFNLEKVHTPVRLLGFRTYSLLNNWEWFAGLRNLGKPVELIWLPEAEHAPVRPGERMTAQQGDVDWFCFWIQGNEDPDAAKVEQYRRWHELRRQQENVLTAGKPD
ncbi:MAG: hypothetical protein LAO20_21790 [Acidobacteriia bacterium]|nr:hypothetical protein [Terriglobia bacterium]